MTNLKMHSPDNCQDNIIKIGTLFPGCVTETYDEISGKLNRVVDFDQLRQELSNQIVEGPKERYRLDWPGKRQAMAKSNQSINKTLRPLKEMSLNFDKTRNLFIEGDNLEALKLLQESYLGRIKLIYIDPPYNTGSDFIYNDSFSINSQEYSIISGQAENNGNKLVANLETNGRFHSNWLSMIYARLRIARNLLTDDGAIIIHIDENEYSNLEKIMAEVFGETNNLGTIIWDKRNPKGDSTKVSQQHEYILCYARNINTFKEKVDFRIPKENAQIMLDKAAYFIEKHGGVNKTSRNEFRKWLTEKSFPNGVKAYSLIDENGDVYQSVSMAWPNNKQAPQEYFKPIVHPKTNKKCPVPQKGWRNPPNTMDLLLKKGEIVFGKDETIQPRRKYLLKEHTKENISSMICYGGSDDKMLADYQIKFDNPKPVQIAKRLIQSVCTKDDTVLDFFAGSGTCGHAILELNAYEGFNLNFILVQLPEQISQNETEECNYQTISDICRARLLKVGEKIQSKINLHVNWNRDVGFRMLKVCTSNMMDVFYHPKDLKQSYLIKDIDNIKQDRTSVDLLFQVLVDWGLDLSLPIHSETIEKKTVYFVDGTALGACFEKDITEGFVEKLAKHNPKRMVFCDNGFSTDSVKINTEQIFSRLSPSTEIRVI